jgi:hypothetical protein
VALFVVLIVAVVVGQTWLDWRDTQRASAAPAWASGVALAGIVGASLTAATSLASFIYQDRVGAWASSLGSGFFWPQLGFLLCSMGIVVAVVRQKRLRMLLFVVGLLMGAFLLGLALST